MIIKSVAELKFYNRFIDIKKNSGNWNFQFNKNNIIYARNGYGKTSLSLIFDSLATNKSLETKKSFAAKQNILIKLKDSLNNEYVYNNNRWNKNIKTIEVFNSFYIEDNTYSIKFSKNKDAVFLEDICDEHQKIVDLNKNISNALKELKSLNQRKINRKRRIRNSNVNLNKKQISALYENDSRLQKINKLKAEKNDNLNKLKTEYVALIRTSVSKYTDEINRILTMFCDNIKILAPKIIDNQCKTELVYGIEINDYQIGYKEREVSMRHPLKYSLSEGDKNALSLSFFLAKINLLKNVGNYIVLIDDPLTSFDTFRKRITVQQLFEISNKVSQFFLLTHDKYFARDLMNKIAFDVCILEIKKTDNGNIIDISSDDNKAELVGIDSFKRLKNFCDNPASEKNLLDLARCIRPLIESILKFKYADFIRVNSTLGEVIAIIRQSDSKSPLNRLKKLLNDLDDIRDYSNVFHHDNNCSRNIEPDELLTYAKRAIELFRKL